MANGRLVGALCAVLSFCAHSRSLGLNIGDGADEEEVMAQD